MKNNIKRSFLLLLAAGLFPLMTLAQSYRYVDVNVEMNDELIFSGRSCSVMIYSFIQEDDAKDYIRRFQSGQIGFNGVPSTVLAPYNGSARVTLSQDKPLASARLTGYDNGVIVLFCNITDWTIDPVSRKINKDADTYPFHVVKKATGRVSRDDVFQDESGKEKVTELEEVAIEKKVVHGTVVGQRVVEEDGKLSLGISYLPYEVHTRPNSRIIIQPYWLDGPDDNLAEEPDTNIFAYAKPVVYDLQEYNFTQIRRMNYDKPVYDSLFQFIVPKAGEATDVEVLADTIVLRNYLDALSGHNPDESYPYPARALVALEDYTERYSQRIIKINEGERTNYIKFLDFTFDRNLDLDMYDFEEKMRVEPRETNDEVNLGFRVGKNYLDPNIDTISFRILDEIKEKIRKQLSEEGAQMKRLQVNGFASPEGSPASNAALAKARAEFATSQIAQVLPYNMRNAIQASESEVKGWGVVVDSLRRDGYNAEADQIQEIIDRYPGNIISQNSAVYKLPCYSTLLNAKDNPNNYLSKLRTVKYSFLMVIDRTMSIDELKEALAKGEDAERFNRAHYWTLLNYYWDKRTEPGVLDQLEYIASRALKYTRKDESSLMFKEDVLHNDGYWALAASILASCYIDRGRCDVDILRPFIDREKISVDTVINGQTTTIQRYKTKLNSYIKSDDGTTYLKYTNNPKMIAQQIVMLLQEGSRKNMEELGDLVDMIEGDPEIMADEKYQKILALANCKRGFYRPGKNCTPERAERTRIAASNISVTNAVILDIALADADGDQEALKRAYANMYEMPDDQANTWYLRSILELMRNNRKAATDDLAQCFALDPTRMAMANNDQQLIYNQDKIVPDAFHAWEEMMLEDSEIKKLDEDRILADSAAIEGYKALGMWEGEDGMIQQYMITTINENHPIRWYEKAVEMLPKYENDDDYEAPILECLTNCVKADKEYLQVIRSATQLDNDVKSKSRGVSLFGRFYKTYKLQ